MPEVATFRDIAHLLFTPPRIDDIDVARELRVTYTCVIGEMAVQDDEKGQGVVREEQHQGNVIAKCWLHMI